MVVKPIYEFEVTNDRFDRALRAIEAARKMLTLEQGMAVFFELGFDDSVTWDGDKPILNLTDLQLVACAAAMAAAAETGGNMILREPDRYAQATP